MIALEQPMGFISVVAHKELRLGIHVSLALRF